METSVNSAFAAGWLKSDRRHGNRGGPTPRRKVAAARGFSPILGRPETAPGRKTTFANPGRRLYVVGLTPHLGHPVEMGTYPETIREFIADTPSMKLPRRSFGPKVPGLRFSSTLRLAAATEMEGVQYLPGGVRAILKKFVAAGWVVPLGGAVGDEERSANVRRAVLVRMALRKNNFFPGPAEFGYGPAEE